MDAPKVPTNMEPSTDGSNGRDSNGRFVKGNAAGRGNPHAKKVAALRAALLASITPKDVREVWRALIKKAKGGDTQAIKELFDRLFGKATGSLELTHNLDSLGSATPILEIQVDSPEHLALLLQNPAIARLALSGNLPGVPHEQAEAALPD